MRVLCRSERQQEGGRRLRGEEVGEKGTEEEARVLVEVLVLGICACPQRCAEQRRQGSFARPPLACPEAT